MKERQFKTPKGSTLTLTDIKGKEYLQVNQRIIWFREEHPDWQLDTEIVSMTDQFALLRCIVRDENGKERAKAHKAEHQKHFADFIEKAETGSIGRALALLGYGTQFTQDFDEGERLADAPLNGKSREVTGGDSEVIRKRDLMKLCIDHGIDDPKTMKTIWEKAGGDLQKAQELIGEPA